MTAGLPGAGIGGIFYLLSALLMPAVELLALLRGRRSSGRWRIIVRQSFLAGGVIAAVWLTGWALGIVLSLDEVRAALGGGPLHGGAGNLIQEAAVFLTFATLGGVLASVHVLRFIVGRRRRLSAPGRMLGSRSVPVPSDL